MTLIELVVAMVLVAIIVGATIYFVYPLRQAVDLTVRADLTDAADNTLQRMGREIRLALPNSVRLATNGGSRFVEFLAVSTAGRYRADGYAGTLPAGTPCNGAGLPDSDQLEFGVLDDCFKPIGTVGATIGVANRLVLNNFGTGFADQNAYETSADQNWRQISAVATAGTNDRIRFTTIAASFRRELHDSTGKRFYVISGPVTYECNLLAHTVTRRSGYVIAANQPDDPTEFVGGTAAVIADDVADCAFSYSANVAAQVGLLTLLLTLSRNRSDGGNETVTLYHAVHVSNVP